MQASIHPMPSRSPALQATAAMPKSNPSVDRLGAAGDGYLSFAVVCLMVPGWVVPQGQPGSGVGDM
jgi:hypothetical protein